MPDTIVPAALRKGDSIAFVSPSKRLNTSHPAALKRAKDFFEARGYKVKVIFDETKTEGLRATTLKRCEELHSAFRDPEVKAVLCTSGGHGADELLRHLDYELIRANPKIFAGYSDITQLIYAIFPNTGLRGFYAPAAITEFADLPAPPSFTVDHFFHVLANPTNEAVGPIPQSKEWFPDLAKFLVEDPSSEEPRVSRPNPGWKWLRPGKTTGRLHGGSFGVLYQFKGTKFCPSSHRGKTLMIETSMGASLREPLSFAQLRLQLSQLVNTGLFDEIAGLLVGRWYGYNDDERLEAEMLLLEFLEGTGFLILSNVDFGHTDPPLTIPFDALASLDSEKNEFVVLEAGVKGD
ncbi:hypothetical protein BP5796_00161 [Coleophoma crateriformis]|uniref:LD-carboxypeptidase n=1 Tax=Coleophoma crateriformis TaxID=565419 RepID=A0A3D8T8R8_9HELO|nr:hypothetical protein BP5796_00161 [Coleophoma crateriformis]